MKRLLVSVLTLWLVFALAPYVYSQNVRNELIYPNDFKLGYEFASFYYSEPGLMDVEGLMQGITAEATSHGQNIMLNVRGSYVAGGLEYTGGTMSGIPVTADTDDHVFELRGLIGYDNSLSANSRMTPFVGIGYRYWNNIVLATGGYEREISYFYIPLGVEIASAMRENWIWNIKMEYDLFYSGEVITHLSDVSKSYNDLVNKQDSGYGLRVSMEFRKVSKNMTFSIKPFVRYWEIDQSDVSVVKTNGVAAGYGIEPENETTVSGLELSLCW